MEIERLFPLIREMEITSGKEVRIMIGPGNPPDDVLKLRRQAEEIARQRYSAPSGMTEMSPEDM